MERRSFLIPSSLLKTAASPPSPLAKPPHYPPARTSSTFPAPRSLPHSSTSTSTAPRATTSWKPRPRPSPPSAHFLASRGTGSFLATTVTAPLDATLRSLEGLGKLIAQPPSNGSARPLGIHLEGPFLSHAKRGVQPAEHLLAPDIATFDRLFDAAEGHVRLITLAPELPGAAELAAHATARGVRVSVGHSNATAAETRAAIAAGAVSATHTFNAMRPLDHREPGILGTVLTDDSLYAELICDGIHSAPEMA